MTLEEKQNAQKLVIHELYSYLNDAPADKESFYNDYLRNVILKILKIEMDYYRVYCLQDDPSKNEINFEFYKDSSPMGSLVAASLINAVQIDTINNRIIHHTPCIKFNFANVAFVGLVHPDKAARMYGCKDVLKTIFHEIRHFRQFQFVLLCVPNLELLLSAKEGAFITSDENIYNMNHDHFGFEIDAEHYSETQWDSFDIPVKEDYPRPVQTLLAAKEINDLVIPDEGFVERDSYIDKWFDKNIVQNGSISSLMIRKPVLKVEYNSDGSYKQLSELIENFNKEREKYEQYVADGKNKEDLITDLEDLYYYLMIKRIKLNNPVELYRAVKKYGVAEIKKLLETLKEHNEKVKNKRFNLLQQKRDALDNAYRKSFYSSNNRGYIKVDGGDENEFVSAKTYAEGIKPITFNDRIINFIKSKEFANLLPEQGYFLDKMGNKVTIEDFVNNMFIPQAGLFLQIKDKNPKAKELVDQLEKFNLNKGDRLLVNLFEAVMRIELTSSYNYEVSNQTMLTYNAYHENEMAINGALELPYFDESKVNNPSISYDDETLDYSDKIAQLYSGSNVSLKALLRNFSSQPPYTEEQWAIFNKLKNAASSLTIDPFLNPNHIDYYSLLMRMPNMMIMNSFAGYYSLANEKQSEL